MSATELDDRDGGILARRTALLDAVSGPRVGDYVRFADGVERRISYDWGVVGMDGIQTSSGGSFYLGNGYVSMSGSLFGSVGVETLTLTDETRDGSVWFFHHDYHSAHNGVDATVSFRVYDCSVESTR